MKIIALAYKEKAKSDFDKSILYAFIDPAWGGNHIVEAEITMTRNDLLDYSEPLVSDTYAEAHRKAHLTQMSEEDYDFLYESKFAVNFPH